LLSGFVQGAAAELVFAFVGYRRWSLPILAVAAVASAAAAWAHDWVIYYAEASLELQLVRFAVMAASAIGFAAFGSLLLERSLRRAGVLEGFGAGSAGRAGGAAG
jgi:energy-coupling factor transport system substrate-specific component